MSTRFHKIAKKRRNRARHRFWILSDPMACQCTSSSPFAHSCSSLDDQKHCPSTMPNNVNPSQTTMDVPCDKTSAVRAVAAVGTRRVSVTSRGTQSMFPLENAWSFYFLKNEQSRAWRDNIVFVSNVETAEEFWSVINHLQTVNKLHFNTDLMVFKRGIQPMWEDPMNINGGRWVFFIDKRHTAVDLDACWLHLLMAIVGDQFGDLDEGCLVGAVLSVRKNGCKIALWTRNGFDEALQRRIGRKFKDVLALPPSTTVLYEFHSPIEQLSPVDLIVPISQFELPPVVEKVTNKTDRKVPNTNPWDDKYKYKE
ncbi:hypothetical protein ACOME3_009863 [Neoechinorhynchus agilis]